MKELQPPESAVKLISGQKGIRSFQQDGKRIQQVGSGLVLFYEKAEFFNE